MNRDFEIVNHKGVELLVYTPWWRHGLVHGMTTARLTCTRDDLPQVAQQLGSTLNFDHLALPSQCHGRDVLDLRNAAKCQRMISEHGDLMRRESSDAVLAPLHQSITGTTIAYGILTADCVPIIARGRDGYALIHAGWRGLQNGIIGHALSFIQEPCEAVVFAAAGGEQYEVGREVVEAIGTSGVYKPSSRGKDSFLLDTAASAANQLRQHMPVATTVSVAGVCTISDARFYSFRRQGEASGGRGVTFVVPQ